MPLTIIFDSIGFFLVKAMVLLSIVDIVTLYSDASLTEGKWNVGRHLHFIYEPDIRPSKRNIKAV